MVWPQWTAVGREHRGEAVKCRLSFAGGAATSGVDTSSSGTSFSSSWETRPPGLKPTWGRACQPHWCHPSSRGEKSWCLSFSPSTLQPFSAPDWPRHSCVAELDIQRSPSSSTLALACVPRWASRHLFRAQISPGEKFKCAADREICTKMWVGAWVKPAVKTCSQPRWFITRVADPTCINAHLLS